MGKLGIKHRAGRWLSVILAFLLPGLGHVRKGHYAKGFLLLAGLLLDYVAIFRLADSDGGRHLLLIVYLVLLLPVFYFISVFEVLQFGEDSKKDGALRLKDGVWLTLAGAFMLVLLKPPVILLPWMNELAEWSVGPLLMLVSIIWLYTTKGGAGIMFRLGRMTACFIMLAVGALLLWDHLQGRNDIAALLDWWPLIFVLLGIEIMLYSTLLRKRASKLRLDTAGIAASLVIAITAYAVTQYADFPVRWLDQFNVDLNGRKEYAEENGFRFDKNVMKVPFDEDVQSLRIENANGDIYVRSGDVAEIEIFTTVWVDLTDEKEAQDIAEQSVLHATPGAEIVFEGKGQAYGVNGNRLPRMNVEIIIPKLEEPPEIAGPGAPSPGVHGDTDQATDAEDSAGNGEDVEDTEETKETEGAAASLDAIDSSDDTGQRLDGTDSPQETNLSSVNDEVPFEEGRPEGQADSVQDETDMDTSQDGEQSVPDSDAPVTEDQEQPSARPFKLNINSGNGSITVMDIHATDGIAVKSGSGLVQLSAIHGDISVEGVNANLEAYSIEGRSSLITKNGSIRVESATADVFASTMNGNLELTGIYGDLDTETKNGGIRISNAAMDIKASTLNGNVEIDSPVVGGNWDLDSSVGEIKLRVPLSGSYTVYGSVTFGNIATDLPLEQTRKTLRGVIGDGIYRIHINATNSISIHGQGH